MSYRDLPQECWGNVATSVKRNCGSAAIRVPILLVGAALPNLCETKTLKARGHLAWLQDGQLAH
jgi:hypothetical protein